jgi:hypothetical protein
MAKRKKQSKVQRRAKLRRGNSAKRGKPRKVARAAKRTVAKAKPKRTPVKEVVRKETVAPAVETLVDTTEIREESEPKPEFDLTGERRPKLPASSGVRKRQLC